MILRRAGQTVFHLTRGMYIRPRLWHMLCKLCHDKQLSFPFLRRRLRGCAGGQNPACNEIQEDRSEVLDEQLGQSGNTEGS